MQKKTPTDWAETPILDRVNGTRPHSPITNTIGRKLNFYNTLYWPQHVYKQEQDGITSELHFRKIFVTNWASVLLNEDTISEEFGHCSACVPIQARLH